MLLRLVVPMLTAAVAVPSYGHLADVPSITPLNGRMTPVKDEPAGTLDVPPNCRLLPPDQQPDRDPEGLAEARRAAGATGQVITLYIPATTCNTPH